MLYLIRFAVYIDDLLKRLQESGVGHRFSVAFVYAEDITLLSPSRSGLSVLISECQKFAAGYNILFNGSKSKLMYFKGRFCKHVKKGLKLV